MQQTSIFTKKNRAMKLYGLLKRFLTIKSTLNGIRVYLTPGTSAFHLVQVW